MVTLSLGYVRLALLARDNLDIHILTDHMEKDLSMIWLRLGRKTASSTILGGIYREQKLLLQSKPNLTGEPPVQLERWQRIIGHWKTIASSNKCTVIGDINLDFLRWENPDYHQKKMVELTQMEIELKGSVQLVKQVTRTWTGQASSCLDHIWSNTPDRVVNYANTIRARSDHNLISMTMSSREQIESMK